MIDKYNSTKIIAVSFLLQIFVVLLHSINLIFNFGEESIKIKGTLNSFIQNLISRGLADVAVPMLFVISGYLFFSNIKTGTAEEFTNKLKNRFKTLALPFLFWSLFGILLFFVLQSFPLSKPFFTKDLVRDFSTVKWIHTIFYLPIAAQLWFIRDLMVLIILSPVIYKSLKSVPKITLLACFTLWALDVKIYLFSPEALFFFITGSYWGAMKMQLQNLYRVKYSTLLLTFWLGLEGIKTLLTEHHIYTKWLLTAIHKIAIITGIVAIWYFYDVVYKNVDITKKKYFPIFKYSFWVYVTHQPLLNIIKKALNSFMGFSNFNSLVVYLLSPVITLVIIIPLAMLLRKYAPKFYFFTTGGR